MNKLFCLLVVLLAGAPAQAHPGSGIVQDGRGNIFFTDLKQVWKITPDGQKSVTPPIIFTANTCGTKARPQTSGDIASGL